MPGMASGFATACSSHPPIRGVDVTAVKETTAGVFRKENFTHNSWR